MVLHRVVEQGKGRGSEAARGGFAKAAPPLPRPFRKRPGSHKRKKAALRLARLLPMLTEEGVFAIIDAYRRLARQGEKILAFRADEYYWRDLGRPADLSQAALDLRQGAV